MARFGYFDDGRFPRYVSVGERRVAAARATKTLQKERQKKGQVLAPVVIDGRKITRTFWGNAWCKNLESYSDYSNRLPRGRSYVRNGSVVDLKIEKGNITALVQGSSLYRVNITVAPVEQRKWRELRDNCAGKLDSLLDLLAGKLSDSVMAVITQKETGLFPSPKQIKLGCSCPDWAEMCKHVAAVLYGIGARLDDQPDLLFALRQVNHEELISDLGTSTRLTKKTTAKTLGTDELESVFGIELDAEPVAAVAAPPSTKARVSKAKARRTA